MVWEKLERKRKEEVGLGREEELKQRTLEGCFKKENLEWRKIKTIKALYT